MRLLERDDAGGFRLTDYFIENKGRKYAILSHTWENEEVDLKALIDGTGQTKRGYDKIRFCGDRAMHDDLRFFWIDTCCIDKSDNTELQEAINSMFGWYHDAAKCYVYLTDVSVSTFDADNRSSWESAFRESRWFTRGWTLQELIAPVSVEFFSKEGVCLGNKKSLEQLLHEITGIPVKALQGGSLSDFSVAERLSWASKRQTLRREDMAYSLLGIFNIHMPLIYGEGEASALRRLQEDINKASNSESPPLRITKNATSDTSSEQNAAGGQTAPIRAIPFARNEDIVDRALFSQLETLLPASCGDGQSAALWGLGGSGKTQVALEYAYRRSRDPACSVFWVHADSEATFAHDYKQMAKKLGVASGLGGEELLAAVRERIETGPRWLLVLDNADNLGLFGVGQAPVDMASLYKFVPRGPGGTVLWTSRDERIAGSLVGARRAINVIRMTAGEATTLFETVRNQKVDDNEADDAATLLAELGQLPLAVSQAAAYMRRTSTPIAKYLSKLKKGKQRWRVLGETEFDRHRRPEVSNSILETWSMSIDHIGRENQMAYKILHILAFIDNQNIPWEVVRAAAVFEGAEGTEEEDMKCACDGEDITDENGGDSTGEDDGDIEDDEGDGDSEDDEDGDDDIDRAVTRLREFSFLGILDSDGPRAYEMHKLVQESIRYTLGRRSAEAEAHHSKAALRVISSLFPEQRRELWDQCEQYVVHAQRVAEWAEPWGGGVEVSNLLMRLSDYLHDRGRWREKELVDKRAYELLKSTIGSRHPRTLTSMASLAVAYYAQGRYEEDEKFSKEVLQVRREVLGDRHPDTLESMASLATTYYALGRYEDHEKLAKEVLQLRRELLGDRHPGTLQSMASLASTYYAQGRYEDHEKLVKEVLQLRLELLGDRHPGTLQSMASLTSIYYKQRRYEEDEQLSKEVLQLRRELLGDRHPDTLESMASLAITYCALEKYTEAAKMHTEVLELRCNLLGNRHPDTIRSIADLAGTHYALGRYEEAEKIYTEVLQLRRDVLGDQHPDTLDSRHKLAVSWYSQNRLTDAIAMMEDSYQSRCVVIGPNHPETQKSLKQLTAWKAKLERKSGGLVKRRSSS